MILPRLRIRRIDADRYALRLPDEEREVLLSLMPQLRDLLTMDDPLARRIFPTAYAQDHERDREYQQLVAGRTDRQLRTGLSHAIRSARSGRARPGTRRPATPRPGRDHA